jgi:hypothetical protein
MAMLFCGTLLAEPPDRLRVIDNSGENLQQVGLGFSMTGDSQRLRS